ncbi:hypothetical protein K4A83_11075 [Spirulina subsalsa FACHB-351]|uniref:Uncharacterized protein n=1 Tax=Spirulina subsalsa FACHB-351 TaxID=234711 RepID=A0ABT3L5N0_9CYAN|nr:hypothetical protein [Spirulina subsalsa]MCW6036799.1 hypothetical protein [Spirulina subsalsa FACHB-351]
MSPIQEQQDQLETRLARADSLLQLLASCQDVDSATLQTAALDVQEHVQQAREICQALVAAQRKGPALSRQPLDCMTCLSVRLYQRPPAAV